MKRIALSIGVIVLVGGVVAGVTGAFFQDTETSAGNVFVAGSVDLKVDHTFASYNGVPCVGECDEVGSSLIVNGGFETPTPTDNGGNWQVYPDGTLTSWDVFSGAGLEIQANSVAGDPHSGDQLAELDSHGTGSQTVIEQVISTVPGQQYRLRFWHSPRPNNGPNDDNAVELDVLVTSTSGVMVNDTIGLPSSTGSNTNWTEYVYNFIALDNQTTVRFGDAGSQADTLGGYLDDVSVRALDCQQNESFPHGGICTVWGERDLGPGDHFWNFPDVKPGDYGRNILSLHVLGNDSFICLLPNNLEDEDNGVNDSEEEAGDDVSSDVGELSGELELFGWLDENNDNDYQTGEEVLIPAGTPLVDVPTEIIELSLTGNAPITLVGLEWCAGEQTGPQETGDAGPVECDGAGMGNIAQTDSTLADLVAYAEQQRNNPDFDCSLVNLDDED